MCTDLHRHRRGVAEEADILNKLPLDPPGAGVGAKLVDTVAVQSHLPRANRYRRRLDLSL